MEKQQPGEDGINAIADIVAKAFTEIKEDMDRIVNSGDVQSPAGTSPAQAASASEDQLPAVQLGHGRTFSESPGYEDIELPDIECRLPEALQNVEVTSPSSPSTALPASSAAEGYGISVRRTYATNATGSRDPSFNLRQQPGSQGSPMGPAACGPCSEFAADLPLADMDDCVDMVATPGAAAPAAAAAPGSSEPASSMQYSAMNSISPASLPASNQVQDAAAEDEAGSPQVASSHLTYTELLERAIAGMDPKLQQMSNKLLTRTSSRTSVERIRASAESVSRRSSGSSGGTRPSSCGRAGPAGARPASTGALAYDGGFGQQQTPGLMSVRPWQAQSKFPASTAGAAAGSPVRRSSARPAEEDGNCSSVRIFKHGSGSAMKLLGELDQCGVSGSAAAGQRGASVRSSIDSQVSTLVVQKMSVLGGVVLNRMMTACTNNGTCCAWMATRGWSCGY
jgi:hypothetical protein